MRKIILSLLLTTMFIGAQAQNDYSKQLNDVKNSYDQDKLTELSNEYSEKYTRLKNEAEAYAILNNIPLKKYNEDGSFDELQRISEDGTPIYYSLNNVDAAISTRANYLNSGGGLGLNLNGNGLTAYVWDGGPTRLTHQEFDGAGGSNRVSIGDGVTALNSNSFHSMHVTGTIVASGFSANAKGMSWQANAITNEWTNDVAEATTAAGNGMLVSNHSYGYNASAIPDDWFGQYGQDAVDWDNLMYNAPYYLMLVAAGNDGADNTSNGAPLGGNSSYDKLNGHATSKNNLVIANGQDAVINGDGSLNSVAISSTSSEGPTDDFRIKPDLTGNGTQLYSSYDSADNAYGTISGTSMATPNVTGTLLLLQEHYNDLNAGFMRAATLKGLALHTADDAGSSGPDAIFGWGLLNAKKAAETITTAAANSGSAIIEELTLSQGQTYQITVQSNGVDPLMASISWTDPAGTVNNGTNSSTPALINDLDIRLDNGTNYTPWRLTGVTTNGTGDNNVDPYERVDVNGASGTYTLTVTHKGILSGGSQNYSLIVTGVVVASSPVISFSSTSSTLLENTDCNFTDIDLTLNIAQAPSANADVSFSVNAGSSAAPFLDFDLLTPNVTFLAGQTTPQTMTLRVYHDGFVEVDELAIIDFTVNANGGNATADTNADTYTLTITNDDVAPTSSVPVVLMNEDFESVPAGWVIADRDGDGNNWSIGTVPAGHLSTAQLFSRSWDGAALTPDNYIITSAVSIPADVTSLDLTYQVSPATLTNPWFEEYYTVYWTTDISTYAAIDGSAQIKPGAIIAQAVVNETIDMTPYAGQTGYIVFRHHNCTDEEYIAIDNVLLQGSVDVYVQTAVNSGTTNDSQALASAGTIYTNDSATGNVMADITNNQADDYGCVDVSVSRAGTGAQSYNGSTAPNLVMDKTFSISLVNTMTPGDTSISFYFTEAEIAGWEAATGLLRADLLVGREVGGTITEVSTTTIGAFGTNVTLTGTFTGLEGDFYFGASGVVAVGTCSGASTTWDGSSWLPGMPTINDPVIIAGDYNTTTNGGSINACTLFIDPASTLIVTAGNYVRVEGNITVDTGATLTTQHEGSLVQVEDNALVTNNGNIIVEKITPTLTDRGFSIMSSPMSSETREGVYSAAAHVRYHDTNAFTPNADVFTQDPGAENFADDDGNNWLAHTGALIVGDGYLVKPFVNGSSSATYTTTYQSGTLNNGVVNFTTLFGDDQNDSPNVLGNPYASAIDASILITNNPAIGGTIYYWEHITTPIASYPGYNTQNYDMGDISLYSLSGGVAAANNGGGSKPSNQFIPSGQGFGIKASSASTITFDNSMRLTGDNTNYRNNISIERLFISIKNDNYDLKSSALIAFTDAATDEYDVNYDTKRLATPISIYSVLGERELTLQGRSAFNTDQVIPLGFRTQVEEEQTYTISLGSREGDNINAATVYLEDRLLHIVTNLTETDYTFTSNESNQKDRFVIVFADRQLGTSDANLEAVSLYPNPTHNVLNIVSPLSTITNVAIYDLRGRMVSTIKVENKSSYQLDMYDLESAMYFVKVTTEAGIITKRVIRE